ncbi:hypothetical protein [Pseudoalteromonas rubra]|uniref:hypothetical protein n=1 Tax=Pseudoalteromonas rubra TaxID=43658 RepID=UPI002DBDD231|nr:hypothetical protein [Pseudoalteromonas rubra]MEC4090735.1 hypothetical protein [Pseudoalteromonas rubra]
MKKITITLASFSLLGILVFVANLSFKQAYQSPDAKAVRTANPDHVKSQEHVSGYRVHIQSAVLSDKGTAFAHSDLTWNMYFHQALGNASRSAALLTDIEFVSDNKTQHMPQQLPFYFSYDGQQFVHSDLLGLAQSHPLSVLPKILDLMSYSLTETLTFNDALGSTTYRFEQDGNTIGRKIVRQQRQTNNKAQESWLLTLKNAEHTMTNQPGPLTLEYSHTQTLQQNTQQYQIVQTVKIQPVEYQPFALANWSASHNASISSLDNNPSAPIVITAENFMAQLDQLTGSLDPMLAKEIGKFMLENYDHSTIKAYLTEHAGLNSALIYSLQKAQTPEAEQTLADLLIERDLDHPSLQKVAMALGRIENASNIAFTSLQAVADDHSDQTLSGVALLSIGTMNKFSPAQSQQVERLLERKLTEPQQLPTAILAIANSKNPALVNRLPEYLNHTDGQVRRNTIKSLANNEAYQDQVVTSLTGAPDVNTVDAFVRTYQRADYTLSEENIGKLTAFYQATTHPIIKKRLASIIQQ